jgi:cyclic pyranopterin phosphate synthase
VRNDRIGQIAVTTNGYRMARDASPGAMRGLTPSTCSVDSSTPASFTPAARIARQDNGIDAAFSAGFEKVKSYGADVDVNHHQLDTFLAWIKSRSIQLRFIELMETGEGSELFRRHHISGMVLRDALLKRGWIHQIRQRSDGPAQVFCHPDYEGEIGLSCLTRKTSVPAATACAFLPSASCISACSGTAA